MSKTQDFMTHIARHSLSRSNRFQVIIPLPTILEEESTLTSQDRNRTIFGANIIKTIFAFLGANNDITRGLDLMTDSTEIPGKQLTTSDIKYNGDFYKMPYGIVYAIQPFNFNISGDMFEKSIIDKWMNMIMNPLTHEVGYYDSYKTDVIINQLDDQDRIVYSIVLRDAFPVSINPLILSNAEQNVAHKMFVSFAYKRWERAGENGVLGSVTSLSQTPLGPYITPILANPVVQRTLQIFETNTGIDLEGEAVNIYNQVDDLVRNTTDQSINRSATLIEGIRASTATSNKMTPDQRTRILVIIDDTLTKLRS